MKIKNLCALLTALPFLAREKGTVAIEFALTLPIWIAILIGSADASYLMIVSQRVDRVAYSVTDIVTQSETLTIADIDNTFIAAGQLMQPFEFGASGIVILTSLYKPSGEPTKITWQYAGGGSLSRGSRIGTFGGSTPALPNGLTLNDNENVIVAEVFYVFEPMFLNAGLLTEGDLYRIAVYKPRLSPLITPPT